MSTDTTTDFQRDASKRRLFGYSITDTHQIGDIQIIETIDVDGVQRFHIYLNEVSIGRFDNSLDAALIVAIAYKYDGSNSRAAEYFKRMIGLGK